MAGVAHQDQLAHCCLRLQGVDQYRGLARRDHLVLDPVDDEKGRGSWVHVGHRTGRHQGG